MNHSENIVNETNDVESYDFTTPVNRTLSKILEIPPFTPEEIKEWKIPEQPGISNSGRIIPIYYDRPENKILTIDYLNIIKDDIRNYRPLNEYQLEYIKKIDDETKNEIIDIFNECLINFANYLLET
jgi:hypothetical protein